MSEQEYHDQIAINEMLLYRENLKTTKLSRTLIELAEYCDITEDYIINGVPEDVTNPYKGGSSTGGKQCYLL